MFAFARLILLFCVGLCAAVAQISTGTIVGIVEDSSGAVIPNAELTIRQTGTAESRTVRTNASGDFTVPFLQPGAYSVTAKVTGFKTQTLSGITLSVDRTMNLKITLEVGASTDTVEVTGAAPLVDSATSSLGQVIENKQILDLPLNGRNPFALGLLVRQHDADVRHGIELAVHCRRRAFFGE